MRASEKLVSAIRGGLNTSDDTASIPIAHKAMGWSQTEHAGACSARASAQTIK